MPELPEVETIVRELRAARLVGRRIARVVVRWRRVVDHPSLEAFRQGLRGRRVESISRRGKYIVLRLSGGRSVLIHLRMSGRLHLTDANAARDKHEHLAVALDDGRVLRFHDTRKFGRWSLLADPGRKLGRLGPEPLSPALTAARFARILEGRHRMLKPLLLDQSVIAGLGNIYVDEALWAAGLHPQQSASSLSAPQSRRLLASIRAALRRGIGSRGTSLGSGEANFHGVSGRRGRNQDALRVFRRTGEPCPRCGEAIVRLRVAQRSSHVCPRCQPFFGAMGRRP